MARRAITGRGKGGGEPEGGPKSPEHSLNKPGLLGTRDGRGGNEANGKGGLGRMGQGRWEAWGVDKALVITMDPLVISSSLHRRAQYRRGSTDSGDAPLNRSIQRDASSLLARKVAHELPQGRFLIRHGPQIGSTVSDRVVDGCFGAVETTHELPNGHMPFSPGHFNGARTFIGGSIAEGLPQVSITVQLDRPVLVVAAKDLVGNGSCVVAVSRNVDRMRGSYAGDHSSDLAPSARREGLMHDTSNGHTISAMNRA